MRLIPLLCALMIAGCATSPTLSGATDINVVRFEKLIEKGDRNMARKRPAQALEFYEAADEIDFFELPNYEAMIRIAEAHCSLGNRERALPLLADFRCALRVDAGELPCYIGEPTTDAPGTDNPALTPGCRQRMCGEVYLDDYAYTNQFKTEHLRRLNLRADRLEQSCSKK